MTTYPCAITIYRIYSPYRPDDGYVGSTVKTIEQRFDQHIRSSHQTRFKNILLYKFVQSLENGWDDCFVEEVQYLPNCASKRERYEEEAKFIFYLSATLNRNRPGALLAFDGDNKLYQHNKYKTDEKERERQAANTKQQLSNKYPCECGGKTDDSHKMRHARTKRHRQFLEATGQEPPPSKQQRTVYSD
jgi:hypothetical protein